MQSGHWKKKLSPTNWRYEPTNTSRFLVGISQGNTWIQGIGLGGDVYTKSMLLILKKLGSYSFFAHHPILGCIRPTEINRTGGHNQDTKKSWLSDK